MGDPRTARRWWRALVVVLLVTGALALGQAEAAPAPPSPERLEAFSLPSPLVDTASPGGRLEAGRSAPKINVLVPEGYDADPGRRYPVLWLLHGANGGTDTWKADLARITEHLPPTVIVMPDGGVFGMYMDWWNGGARGGPAWASYHLGLLRDVVEERYRIRPERRWHAVGGISMGGQGALRYAALLPGYFGSVAAFSAALPDMQTLEGQGGVGLLVTAQGAGATYEAIYGRSSGAYAEGNSPQALAANYEHTRMYLTSANGISCPGDEIRPAAIVLDTITETFLHHQQGRFARAARDHGAQVTDVRTCGTHTFEVWDRALPAAVAWGFFEPVPEHPPSWTYRTVATTGEVWGLAFRFAAPPAEVVEIRRTGTRLSVTGDGHLDLTGEGACRISIDLPFDGELPPACR